METNQHTAFSEQVGGSHYKAMPFQPIKLISMLELDFFQGNVVKYVSRYKLKDGVRDLEKAKHYCRMAMEMEKSSPRLSMTILQAVFISEGFVASNGLSKWVADVIVYVYRRKWNEAVKAIDALSKEYNQSELEAAKENDGGERLGDDKPKIERAQQWDVKIVYLKAQHNTPKE
jgi:bbp48|nr:MAG TPA: nucelotide kinase [Caudoviricetes sp.]